MPADAVVHCPVPVNGQKAGSTAAQLVILLMKAAAAHAGNQAEATPRRDHLAACTGAFNQSLDATHHRTLTWA